MHCCACSGTAHNYRPPFSYVMTSWLPPALCCTDLGESIIANELLPKTKVGWLGCCCVQSACCGTRVDPGGSSLPTAATLHPQGSRMGWLAVSLGFGMSFGVVIFMFGEFPSIVTMVLAQCRHGACHHGLRSVIPKRASRYGHPHGAATESIRLDAYVAICSMSYHGADRTSNAPPATPAQATSRPTSTLPPAWRCG